MPETTFDAWYREAQPGLLEAVLRAVNRRAVAEDALDEAFAKAFSRWSRVQTMRSPTGWVFRVAINEARRQLAREVREAERLAVATPARSLEPPPGGEAWLLVAELPVRQRTAVVLRHVAAMTEVEVAAAMGVTRSTVSSALASAYKTLARALTEPAMTEEAPLLALTLALATVCDDLGCDIEHLDGRGDGRAAWSSAVRDTIKVRPGDLVAVDGSEVVWRWWVGTVVGLEGDTATIERNITQRRANDPRTGRSEAAVTSDLDIALGDRVWFGPEGDGLVVVAAGSPEAVVPRVAPRLPVVAQRLRG